MSVDGKEEWLENKAVDLFEEIQNVSNHGIWVSVRFYNEKEED